MNILIIAAHPDDEVLGCAGTTLKRINEGHTVYVCIVTRAPEGTPQAILDEKRKEAVNVGKFLGVKDLFFLNYSTVALNTIPHGELNKKIREVIEKCQAEIVYTHHRGDNNMDHRIIFDATLVATRPEPGQIVKKLYSFESLSSTEWGAIVPERAFVPNTYEDITPYLEKKIDVMKLYKSEIRTYPHPRSPEGIRIHAQERGLRVGCKAAEAFVLIREFL